MLSAVLSGNEEDVGEVSKGLSFVDKRPASSRSSDWKGGQAGDGFGGGVAGRSALAVC